MSQTATSTVQLTPYLFFDGNCEEALHFYEKALDGSIASMTRYKEASAPDQTPADLADKVLNGLLHLPGGASIYAGDRHPMFPYEGIKGVSMALTYSAVAEAERIFAALSEGGEVTMPFGPVFWAKGGGMLTDRFGTPWIVSGELFVQPA